MSTSEESFRKGKIAGARSFAKLVKEMRDQQRRYFQTRSNDALKKAKQLEDRVDRSVQVILTEKT